MWTCLEAAGYRPYESSVAMEGFVFSLGAFKETKQKGISLYKCQRVPYLLLAFLSGRVHARRFLGRRQNRPRVKFSSQDVDIEPGGQPLPPGAEQDRNSHRLPRVQRPSLPGVHSVCKTNIQHAKPPHSPGCIARYHIASVARLQTHLPKGIEEVHWTKQKFKVTLCPVAGGRRHAVQPSGRADAGYQRAEEEETRRGSASDFSPQISFDSQQPQSIREQTAHRDTGPLINWRFDSPEFSLSGTSSCARSRARLLTFFFSHPYTAHLQFHFPFIATLWSNLLWEQ